MQKLTMIISNKIKVEKLQQDTLTLKQQSYYHQVKLMKMKILQMKKCYLLFGLNYAPKSIST